MAITTNIKNYPATHGKNEGGGGGTTIIMGGGKADIPANLNVTSINAEMGDISLLKGKSLTFNDGQFIYFGSSEGTVNKITGDELKYKLGVISELHSDSIKTKTLETDDLNAVNAWIETLNSKSITTEYLTVTKQAHFFELVIDKIKSVGGQMIMTATNCVVDYAKAVDANGNYLANLDDASAKAYDIFWLSSDASGRAVTNDWQVNDQAICQSFNNVSTGVNYDVSNKYYWRLVTRILTDRYMNLSTGAELPLGQSQQATVNSVTITAPYLADENDTRLDTGWHTEAQQITGVITGATWTETSGGAGEQTIGTMTTTNTVFGIQITPVEGEATETVNANYFGFSCTPARLNVGIYYTDGTSQYFVAPDKLQSTYRYETLTQAPIEAIVITNAEEVEWKLVHGIRLSNTDCDEMLDGYASIPSAGDNVIQLGYRYNEYEQSQAEYDIPRSSAIIIAAYHTPDSGLTPPSYAQYTKITDYNLASHRQTYIDANGSRFVGDFYVDANTSIQDLINESTHTQYYLHIAYANSSDGKTDFTKTPVSGVSYSYMGYCSNSTASDASLKYTDYQWVLVPGESTQIYRLIDNGSQAYVKMSLDDSNNVAEELVISLNYKVAKFIGGTVTFMTKDELSNFPKEYGNANGLYAYVRHTKSDVTTETKYCWYRLTLNEDGTLTYSYKSTNSLIVNNNPTIEVRLIPYNITLMPTTSAGLNYTKDSLFVPITLLPNAAFKVVQGDHASIATLVTGQEGNKQAISTLKQDMESITTKVTTIEGNYVNASELEQTAKGITSTVLETVRKEIDYKVEQFVDLTDLDVNKFYPISIRLCANGDYNSYSQSNDRVRIVIDRTLDYDIFGNIKSDTNMTPNAYGTHNSNNGFDAVIDYTTQASGWGATWTSSGDSTTWGDNELNGQGQDTYRFINNYLVHWTVNQSYTYNSKTITVPRNAIFGSIRQNYMTSTEIVYARGGSKYTVRTDWRYAKIDKHPEGYDWVSGNYRRTAPVITWTDDSSLIIPEKDQMQKSEIIQTASNIQLNVYDQLKEKTGIDVSSGQIILDADNTIINGSLKLKNANEGVIIYNDNGQAAVEVVKDTIGKFGESQNVTSYYKSTASTYSYIIGENNYKTYVDPVDTSAGYSSEQKYTWETSNQSACVSLGNLKAGVKIIWNAKNFGVYINGWGGNYNSYTGQYAYKVEGLNTANYTLNQSLQVRIRLRNVYDNTWYTIKDWQNLTSVSSSSLDAWTSIPHSSGIYYWLNGVDISYEITNEGTYELFFDYRMSNPTISGTSKLKLFNFQTYLAITNEISINTKIGTDGMRTITPNTEFWAGADQISNIYQNSDNTGIYGSGIDSFGYTVTKYGPTQAFGTQFSSLTAYDNVRQLIHVSGSYSGNNRSTGKVKYNTSTPLIGGTMRYEFCYNFQANGIMPGIVVFDDVGGSYPNVDPYFTFTYNPDDILPTGLTVIIINHSHRTLHVAAHRSLQQKMYYFNGTGLNQIEIEIGHNGTFVHLGDNYYKLIHYS